MNDIINHHNLQCGLGPPRHKLFQVQSTRSTDKPIDNDKDKQQLEVRAPIISNI